MKKIACKSLLLFQYIIALFFVIILVYYSLHYTDMITVSVFLIGVVIMYSMFKHAIYRDSLLKSIINLAWVIILSVSVYLFVAEDFINLIIFWLLITIFVILLFRKIKTGKSRIIIEIFLELFFYSMSLLSFAVIGLVYTVLNHYMLQGIDGNLIFVKRLIQLFLIYSGLMIPYQLKMLISSVISIDESIYTLEEQHEALNKLSLKYKLEKKYKTIWLEEEDYQIVEMFITQRVLQSLVGVSNFEYYAKIGLELRLTNKGLGIKNNNDPIEKIQVSKKQNLKAFIKTCIQMKLFTTIMIILFGGATIFLFVIILLMVIQVISIIKSNIVLLLIIGLPITFCLWITNVISDMNVKFHKLWSENKEELIKKDIDEEN